MINEKNVKAYCSEDISLIENYYKAVGDTKKWDCHHRLEIQDDKVMSLDALKKAGLYYNRPASELIFMTHCEHVKLHTFGKNNPMYGHQSPMYGKNHSEETRSKMSKAQKGENNHNFGKHHSEETKLKMSKSHLGHKHSEEAKQKMKDAWIKRKTKKELQL